MVFIRKCSFVVSLIFCFLSFYDLVIMAITKMIMSVAQSLRNFLMTVIGTGLCRKYCSQFCFEISKKTKMTITNFAFEGYCLVLLRVTEAFKRTIAHVRGIVLCFAFKKRPR